MPTPNGRGGWNLDDDDVAEVRQASFGGENSAAPAAGQHGGRGSDTVKVTVGRPQPVPVVSVDQEEAAGERLRSRYRVPAYKDGRIRYSGGGHPVEGTIVGFSLEAQRLQVRLDGHTDAVTLHPTYKVEYLAWVLPDDGITEIELDNTEIEPRLIITGDMDTLRALAQQLTPARPGSATTRTEAEERLAAPPPDSPCRVVHEHDDFCREAPLADEPAEDLAARAVTYGGRVYSRPWQPLRVDDSTAEPGLS